MALDCESHRTVFQRIAQRPYAEWPVYDLTPLYDRSSLAGLESDVRVVSESWFEHGAHDSVEQFVCSLPLAYFAFETHDRYSCSTRYEMDTLFRVFVQKELHGWTHETALVEYLEASPEVCERLGLKSIPDQSTLWRSWNKRFTTDLRETVETAARTVLIKGQNSSVAVPREPERNLLLEIVTTLEEQGFGRDEYQLQRVIDIEALEQLVNSAGTDLEVRFSVGEFRLCVTQTDVQVLAGP